MTAREAINAADVLKLNDFPDKAKIAMIDEIEGRIQTEVMLLDPSEISRVEIEDADKQLLAPAPYDRLYVDWLICQIDRYNGEYNKYANTVEMFNNSLDLFAAYYIEKYRPADRKYERENPHVRQMFDTEG